MEASEVKLEFEKLLDTDINDTISVYDICYALYQLADRQYHTYTILDKQTQDKIAIWVEKNWINDLQFISNLGMIGGSIGIRKICDLLKLHNTSDNSLELKNEIEETLKEIEPNIDNPYADLSPQ